MTGGADGFAMGERSRNESALGMGASVLVSRLLNVSFPVLVRQEMFHTQCVLVSRPTQCFLSHYC